MDATLTRAVAEFTAHLSFEALPPDVVELLKLHLLDTIGNALAGAGSDLAQACLAVARLESSGACPVLGSDARLGPSAAAFANAAAMNALDHDDGFEVDGKGLGHPGATIVAAALSALSMRPADGRTLLVALAAAYEINGRLILSIQPSIERFRQVYGVQQHGTIGAACAYGRLVGLDVAAQANALGFAGAMTPVPSLRKYNWSSRPLVSFKDFNAPAASLGVRAVQCAEAGLVGAADIFDGEHGFWRMIGSDRFDPDLLVDGLGTIWWARHASLKPYPACRWIHTALESFQTVRDREQLAVDDIARIDVLTAASLARDFMDRGPGTTVDRQFSLPWALANLACRRPMAEWHLDPADPRHDHVTRCVQPLIDGEIETAMDGGRRPAGAVRVTLVSGRTLEGPRLDYPLGTFERPMERGAVLAKFRANAAPRMKNEQIERLELLVSQIEKENDARSLLSAVNEPK